MLKATVVLTTVVLLGACAGTHTGTARPINSNLITHKEVVEAGPSSAYDLIAKLRPLWLQKRGEGSFFQPSEVVIYLDGTRLGGPDELQNISSTNIDTLQFLDARLATLRFGAGHVAGAILIKTLQ
jgi:hypothetical protein